MNRVWQEKYLGTSQTGEKPDREGPRLGGGSRQSRGSCRENSSDVVRRVRLRMRAEMMPSLVQGVKMEELVHEALNRMYYVSRALGTRSIATVASMATHCAPARGSLQPSPQRRSTDTGELN